MKEGEGEGGREGEGRGKGGGREEEERRMFDATLAMARAGNKKMEDVDMQLLEEQGEGVWKREREGRREGERGKGGGEEEREEDVRCYPCHGSCGQQEDGGREHAVVGGTRRRGMEEGESEEGVRRE